jgi:hypothetical protein
MDLTTTMTTRRHPKMRCGHVVVPQETPDTNSDIEAEMSVEVFLIIDKLPSQPGLFSRPHATGHGRLQYKLLDAMTSDSVVRKKAKIGSSLSTTSLRITSG